MVRAHREVVRTALLLPAAGVNGSPDYVAGAAFVAFKRPNGKHHGYAEYLGGGVEPGERPIEAALREIDEEARIGATSIDPLVRYATGSVELTGKDEIHRWHLFVTRIREPDALDTIALSEELASWKLVPVRDLTAVVNAYPDLQQQSLEVQRYARRANLLNPPLF